MWHTFFGQAFFYLYLLTVIVIVQALIFLPLSYFFPAKPSQPLFRRDMVTDLLFYFSAGIIIGPANILFLNFLHDTFHLANVMDAPEAAGSASPGAWYLAVHLILTIALVDFLQYWIHRSLLHGKKLWKIHAIHHCSPHVDWLSNNRAHPINFILLNTVVFDSLGFFGFDPYQSLWGIAFYTIQSGLAHANLGWTYGPLRYVLTSPVYHRWHHTAYDKGGNKNFAVVFPVFDLLFGTYYMPENERPLEFGTSEPVPEGFWGQVIYPFRNSEKPLPRRQA